MSAIPTSDTIGNRPRLDVERYGKAHTIDMNAVRQYRLRRVREQLERLDYAGCLLFDPLNIRYATDSTNMQVWITHNAARYLFIATDGPSVLFDFHNCEHLSAELGTVDEVRHGTGAYYFGSGPRLAEFADRLAAEIADLVHEHGAGNCRLGVDGGHPLTGQALQRRGIEVHDGQEPLEMARVIKSAGEIDCMRASIAVCQLAMREMHERAVPGMSENELWSILHQVNIANGGEWIETRLLAAGGRTNPWFQECSMEQIAPGDMISYDTDLIGPYGYCADLSRSFVCGQAPSGVQRDLYRLAVEQIEFNIARLAAGMRFSQYANESFELPPQYRANRYSVVAHGIGLCDEYPHIAYTQDIAHHGYDGEILPGMTLCIESYIGADDGHEGVKLEQQVLVTEDSVERLSNFPYDEALLGREF